MIMQDMIYLLPVICSVAGALLCLLPIRSVERIASVLASLAAFGSVVFLFTKENIISDTYYVDGLSKLLSLTIGLLYPATVLYSLAYLKHIRNPLFKNKLYYFLLNLFASTMFFSVSMDNIGLIWVGIEATTVTSALLVATENDQVTIESAWRYVIIVSTGLVISLIATTFIFGSSRTLSMQVLMQAHPDNRVFLMGILLGLIGFGTKAGIFPMHTWLPDVHGRAPAPVSAIFSGVLLPVALYAMARLIQIYDLPVVKNFCLTLGILTIIVAALMMTVQNNYKRMFAYSSMENMGMILIGFSLGNYGLLGAVVLILSHGLAKSSAFYLSGNILSVYHSTKLQDVHGLFRKMPVTGFTLFLTSMAVTGAPPFAVFAGEFFIFREFIHQYSWWLALMVIGFVAIAFIALNVRTGRMIFTGNPPDDIKVFRAETWVPVINLILSVLVIFMIPFIEKLLVNFLSS
jgi:hydrogenase-4 component F